MLLQLNIISVAESLYRSTPRTDVFDKMSKDRIDRAESETLDFLTKTRFTKRKIVVSFT